jgi:hypothetical protein
VEITNWDTIVNEAEKIKSTANEVAHKLCCNTEQVQAAKARLARYTDVPNDLEYSDKDAIDSQDSEQEDHDEDIPMEAQNKYRRAEDSASEETFFNDNDNVVSTESHPDMISDELTPEEISQYMRKGLCFNWGEHGHIARWCPFCHMRDDDQNDDDADYEDDKSDDGNASNYEHDDFKDYYHSEDGAQSSDEDEEYEEYDENRYHWNDHGDDKPGNRYSLNCIMIVSDLCSNGDEKNAPINQYLSIPLSRHFVQPIGKVVQNKVEGEWDTQNPGEHNSNKFWNEKVEITLKKPLESPLSCMNVK